MPTPQIPPPELAPPSCDEFLTRWRHALRTPLNAILAACGVLESTPSNSPAAQEAREIIARQARHLAWLISDLPGSGPDGR